MFVIFTVYDSFGKMGSNMVGGNVNQPGLMSECRSAHAPSFSGLYCQVSLTQGKVFYFVGICVPDSCEDTDAHMLVLEDQITQTQQDILRHCMQQFLQAFSLQTTTQGILSTMASVRGSYPSLNGIRALSVLWIISGHALRLTQTIIVDNTSSLGASLKTNPLHLFTVSAGIYLGVDSFLLLGGLLSAKSLLSSIQRNDDTMSLGLVAGYIFKRIRRIQPLHMFVLLLYVGFTSVISGGPYGNCIPWTWYLSLDMQCYVITPLLILAHRKSKVVFVISVIGLLMMTALTGSILVAYARTLEDYLFFNYYKPYSRCGTFVIGILFGMYLKLRKESLLKKKWQVALGWVSSLSVLALVVGLGFVFNLMPDPSAALPAIYHGLNRMLWVTALSWVILACEEGHGGFIMSLLSLKFWVPLANLIYASYLIHPFIIYIFIALQETPLHYLDINFMYLFFGHTVLTLPVSYALTVLVERPFVLLKWK
ncbi:O-acyltransferase like protein-like [Neosynchiropus ocellatus]